MTISVSALNKTSKRIGASGVKFNQEVQTHLVNIMTYCFRAGPDGNRSGDVTPATYFLAQITRKADRLAIIKWLSKYGALRYSGDDKAEAEKAGDNVSTFYGKAKPSKKDDGTVSESLGGNYLMSRDAKAEKENKANGISAHVYKVMPDFEAAKADLWHDMVEAAKTAAAAQPWNFKTRLLSFVAQANKAIAEGRIEGISEKEMVLFNAVLLKLNGDESAIVGIEGEEKTTETAPAAANVNENSKRNGKSHTVAA